MKHLVRWSLLASVGVILLSALAQLSAAYRFARAVLTPPGGKLYDLTILALGYERGELATVTLPLNDDTVLPGVYSLVFEEARGVVTVGEVLTVHPDAIVRRVLSQTGVPLRVGTAVRFNGWMGISPSDIHSDWKSLLFDGPIGRVPAWYVPPATAESVTRWAIHIHGRSAIRAETLRGVAITRELGFHSISCSYRNDPEAAPPSVGRYALGVEEWRDIDSALRYAVSQGAKEIVLYGWSMGGAIALQVLKHSPFRDRIRAIVLDSPVLDWKSVLRFHGRLSHLPNSTMQLGFWMLERGLVRSGAPQGIPFDALSAEAVLRGDHVPVLVLHSSDDGYVPIEPAEHLARNNARVTLKRFSVARHCKLWNFDKEEYERAVKGWLQPILRASS